MERTAMEYKKVQEAAAFLKNSMPFVPKVGIILGTGWGSWLDHLEVESQFPTADIPNMAPPSVASHKGLLAFAFLQDIPVVLLAGRIHYYEGHEMNVVVRPVRILREIGCTHLVITNAAGGLNPEYEAGDLVALRDHINLMHAHPLRGPNEERWGPRFPDMMKAYDRDWITYVQDQAVRLSMDVKTGVYAGVPGPSLETPAEYEYLHRIGADLVGMSAVPEVIAAHHIGLKILAVSIVSNLCYPPERIRETTVEDVITMVQTHALKAGNLIRAAVAF